MTDKEIIYLQLEEKIKKNLLYNDGSIILDKIIKRNEKLIQIYNEINDKIDIGKNFNEKIYIVLNKIYDQPKCKICGKELNFLNNTLGFGNICSDFDCRTKYNEINKKNRYELCFNNPNNIIEINELKILIKNNFLTKTNIVKSEHSIFISNNFDLNLMQNIYYYTNFLNKNCSFNERIYCIINDIKEKVKCKMCNNTPTYMNFTRGYLIYCSDICSNKDEERGLKLKNNIERNKKISETKKKLFQDDEYKQDYLNKVKKTNLEKYGSEISFKNFKSIEKRKNTWMNNYGVIHPLKSENIKNKIKDTVNKKYNVDCYFQSTEFKDNNKNFLKLKYNVKNISQVPEIKLKKLLKNRRNNYYKIISREDLLFHVKPLFNLEDYEGNEKLYLWKCNRCNLEFYSNLTNFKKIPKCPTCFPIPKNSSIIEHEIKLWINNYIKANSKRFYYYKQQFYEIDIYIEELNLGIECDGIYWHSEVSGDKDKNYHLNKTNFFKEKNIDIIHIFDNEWINKKNIIKSILLNKINKTSNKIYARNCSIKLVSNKESNEFLEKNHLQGKINSKINVGLYYNNNLVQLLNFGKPRYNKNYEYELLRFSTILDGYVIGGFSKCLNYFVKNYSNSIVTYADKRYSNGKVYLKNNFKLISESNPNYYYTKDYSILESRLRYQKHKLKYILPNYNENLSEWENMKNNNYDRIWDCGNYVFEYKK